LLATGAVLDRRHADRRATIPQHSDGGRPAGNRPPSFGWSAGRIIPILRGRPDRLERSRQASRGSAGNELTIPSRCIVDEVTCTVSGEVKQNPRMPYCCVGPMSLTAGGESQKMHAPSVLAAPRPDLILYALGCDVQPYGLATSSSRSLSRTTKGHERNTKHDGSTTASLAG
jgi:hypothetical protein